MCQSPTIEPTYSAGRAWAKPPEKKSEREANWRSKAFALPVAAHMGSFVLDPLANWVDGADGKRRLRLYSFRVLNPTLIHISRSEGGRHSIQFCFFTWSVPDSRLLLPLKNSDSTTSTEGSLSNCIAILSLLLPIPLQCHPLKTTMQEASKLCWILSASSSDQLTHLK